MKSSLYHQVCHIDHFVIIKISLLANQHGGGRGGENKNKLSGLLILYLIK